jgi:hypothetical protein
MKPVFVLAIVASFAGSSDGPRRGRWDGTDQCPIPSAIVAGPKIPVAIQVAGISRQQVATIAVQ